MNNLLDKTSDKIKLQIKLNQTSDKIKFFTHYKHSDCLSNNTVTYMHKQTQLA